MIRFFVYYYCRALKYYEGSSRTQAPIQIYLGCNFASIIILFRGMFRLLAKERVAFLDDVPGSIVITGGCWVITLIFIGIAAEVCKKNIGQKFVEFDRETEDQRKRHKNHLVLYTVLSFAIWAGCFLI
jgi:hypothetical protein